MWIHSTDYGFTLGREDDDETPCNTWNVEQCRYSFEYVVFVCLSKMHL